MAPGIIAANIDPVQSTVPVKQIEAEAQEKPKSDRQKFFEDVHFIGDKKGNVVIRSPPEFANAFQEREYKLKHLAAAYRVFAKQGFDEGTAGHISLRDPVNPGMYWPIVNPQGLQVQGYHQSKGAEPG